MTVEEFIQKHELDKPPKIPVTTEDLFLAKIAHDKLFDKWKDTIGENWYGFALWNNLPLNWYLAIDDLLEYIKTVSKKFEIHQIKIKYGGLRFYVYYDVKDDFVLMGNIDKLIETIEKYCQNKEFVY